ncbi:MAG TPA: GDSL-type esterase/lipase family protein [Xanthobacteraceae bacterium]|jgi:lysophospholipase L1-like esterase
MNKSMLMFVAPALAVGLLISPALAQNGSGPWVTAWASSQQAVGQTKISKATVRMIARVTLPGESVRIRLDNTFGAVPASFGRISIGPRIRGPALAAGLVKPVTFGGASTVTIPAGGTVESDPVPLHVDAQQDLGVSLYVTGSDLQPSQHNNAFEDSYLTPDGAGDQTGSENGKPFTRSTTAMFWLKSIDVRPQRPATAIVAFGDSITDGTCTVPDAHERWEDTLAQRLALRQPVERAVVNEGIAGNTVSGERLQPAATSTPGIERLDRDVLSHAGVSHVILFMGTNDIRREAPADQVIAGMKNIIGRVKARGLKIIGATIIPRHSVVPGVETTGWNDAKTKVRNQVNDWIRKATDFDGVLDFDKIVRSAGNPDLIEPAYNCGDGIHPSSIGYFQMGKSVDLGLFGLR